MKWKIILFMMVMLMLELVHAAPSISLDILSNDTYNTSNSIFNITLTGNGECNGGNTSWWNSTGKQQILGLDFNINETDSNFWDYTENGNNVTCTGTGCPMFNVSCGVDGSGCYVYNGSQAIIKNNVNGIINPRLNGTISIWVYTNMSQNSRLLSFSNQSMSSTGAEDFQIRYLTPNITFNFRNSSNAVVGGVTMANYKLNVWNNYVVVWNGTNIFVYNNGKLNGTGIDYSVKNIYSINLTFLHLGYDYISAFFNGSIDDVRIYNYALSSQEVSELYNASVAKRSPRLLPEQTTNGDIWQASAVCSNRTTYSARAIDLVTISDCITLLANTSYAPWLNTSSCDFYDHILQSSNFTTYDANNCGTFSNITYNATQNTSCVFCAGQNISLCTYQTNKMEGENMLLGLILIPLVLGIMFLAASFFLSEEHTIFKIFLFGLSFISATASLYMASVAMTYLNAAETVVQTAISNTMLWVSWVDFILIIYIFVYITIKIMKALKQNNEDKLKY